MKNIFKIFLTLSLLAPIMASENMEVDTMKESVRNSHITKLDLSEDQDLTDLEFLRFFPNLRELNLHSSYNLGDNYQGIRHVTKLESLTVFDAGLMTYEYLTSLPNLKYLCIKCSNMGELVDHLVQLPNLEELYICGEPVGVEELSRLIGLKKLSLQREFSNSSIESIDFLSNLTNLRELDLAYQECLIEIKPLIHLPNLTHLDLSGIKDIQDISNLKELRSLVSLVVSGNSSFYEDIQSLTEARPDLKISFVE